MPTYYNPDTGKPVSQQAKQYYDPDTGKVIQPATEVSGAQESRPQMPQMSAAETGIVPTLEEAQEDLLHGGGLTMLGRGLGFLQGRGDKGYSGLESGVSPETAQFMGSPELGTLKMAQGGAEIGTGHPFKGVGHVASGALQASTIPASFVGPEVADAAIGMIPSKAHAIHTLGEVGEAAKDIPLKMSATEPALGDFRQYVSTGGRGSQVVNKLGRRMAAVDEQGPINFPEGRQFYTNVSRATARPGFLRRAIESPAMPDMRRNLGGVREAMNSDLTDAANSVGMGDKYAQGMSEYANAAKLNKALKIGGAVVGEEALRRSGILGKAANAVANMAQ